MDFFQFGYLFAIGGGIVGSAWSSIKDHDKIVSSVFEAVVSAVAAAAVVERFLMVNQVWTCAIAGAFVGIFKTLAPGLMKKWVKKTADKFIDSKE